MNTIAYEGALRLYRGLPEQIPSKTLNHKKAIARSLIKLIPRAVLSAQNPVDLAISLDGTSPDLSRADRRDRV